MGVQVTNLVFDWNRSGAPFVRWYVDSPFVDTDGITHPAQPAGGQDYLIETTCSVASGRASAPTFTLPETWDEVTNLRATLTAYVLDPNRRKAFILVSGYRIPGSLGGTVTWEQLAIHNADHATLRDTSVYTKEQVNALIASVQSNFKGTFTKATLPTSGASAGWLAYVSDDSRGLWIYNGSRWRAVGNELNLYDCGAACDGVTNDSAAVSIAFALLSASPNNGITLKVPGVTRIATPVVASLSLRGTHAKIEGTSGRSAFYIDVSATQDAMTFSGCENLTIQDLVFVGHPTAIDDCKHAVVINNCEQVAFQNVQFYGIYAALNGAVLKINNSSVYMHDCAFKGCSGSQITTSVVRILLHRAFAAYNIIFKDFGVWDNTFYSKVPLGLVNAWIELNSVQGGAGTQIVSDMTNQGEFLVDGFRGDEGALAQIMVNIPDGQKDLARAVVRNANFNVSGLDGDSACYFDNVVEARVEDSWMGYATASSRRAFFVRECQRFIVRNSVMAEGVSVIDLNTSTPYAEFENLRFVRTSPALDTFITGSWGNLVLADSRNTYIRSKVRDMVAEGQAFLLAAAGTVTHKDYRQGALRVRGLAVPAPSVTPLPSGATTYTYWVVAVDRFGRKVLSEPVTITNGPAALSGAAFNRIQWTAVGGAVEYRVMRNSATAYVTGSIFAPVDPLANSFTFDDIGNATDTYFTVDGNETGDVEADGRVVARGGLKVGSGPRIKDVIKGTVTVDPNAVLAGQMVTRTATLTGAVVGDVLELNEPTAGLNTIVLLAAWVSAANQISAKFFNPTGGGVVHSAESFPYKLTRS